jgi:hypothetical protein
MLRNCYNFFAKIYYSLLPVETRACIGAYFENSSKFQDLLKHYKPPPPPRFLKSSRRRVKLIAKTNLFSFQSTAVFQENEPYSLRSAAFPKENNPFSQGVESIFCLAKVFTGGIEMGNCSLLGGRSVCGIGAYSTMKAGGLHRRFLELLVPAHRIALDR